ncbi:MAG TPA: beta-ketoacyl-[acyl-carrier-protein] synthase family protein [Anaeromyxobacteraceae bacterium]|nr:beta-ketoacyl-[acyl-carrier-protein] synthase family protein [Anaeromyxobacteraceae bacterium]
MTRRRVVVTGLGIASPLGCDVETFWSRLSAGESGVVALEGPGTEGLATRVGGRVQGYVETDHFDRKEVRRTSRTSQLAVVAASQAVRQSRILEGGVDLAEAAVLIGSSIGGFSASDGFFRDYYLNGKAGPLIIPTSMNTGPSANVSIRFGLGGPLFNVDGACASGTHSIGQAFRLVRSGAVDVAVAGGADSCFTAGVVAAWDALRVLSSHDEEPARACRPFSADRDGIVLAEGAGVLVLESEESARRRGQPVLGEVLGYGASADCHSLTQPAPEGPVRAIAAALKDAGLAPGQVGYVNAHGTGTEWNDRTETIALKRVFGEAAHRTLVVSSKGALGHGIGAGGAMELVGCLMALRDRKVPPTINRMVPDPECDLDHVTEGARPYDGDHVLKSSFAFGGSNAVLVVGRHRA